MNVWFGLNSGCCGIHVQNGMVAMNEGIWKVFVCSPVAWCNGSGDVCRKVKTPLSLCTIGGAILFEIVVSCWP